MIPFRSFIVLTSILSGLLAFHSVFAYESVFDRLDGTGPSKKRVDVIEWEGNLEIHVYPKTSLKGVGVKLDEREKGKKVMVIGYHLNGNSEPLVRRAILGVPFNNNLKGYIDPTEKEFDKIAITNGELQKPWVPYKLMPAPKQWGPDGSKHDDTSTEDQLTEMRKNDQMDYNRYNRGEGQMRSPASVKSQTKEAQNYVHPAQRKKPTVQKKEYNDSGVEEYSW